MFCLSFSRDDCGRLWEELAKHRFMPSVITSRCKAELDPQSKAIYCWSSPRECGLHYSGNGRCFKSLCGSACSVCVMALKTQCGSFWAVATRLEFWTHDVLNPRSERSTRSGLKCVPWQWIWPPDPTWDSLHLLDHFYTCCQQLSSQTLLCVHGASAVCIHLTRTFRLPPWHVKCFLRVSSSRFRSFGDIASSARRRLIDRWLRFLCLQVTPEWARCEWVTPDECPAPWTPCTRWVFHHVVFVTTASNTSLSRWHEISARIIFPNGLFRILQKVFEGILLDHSSWQPDIMEETLGVAQMKG